MPESKFNIDDLSKEYKSKISKMDIQPLPQPSPSTQVSPIESALRGGAQGLTMGLSSRGEALLRNLAGKTPFLPEKSYEQALQESRQAYKQAQEANPIIYTGSEIAGGVAPFLIPGTQPATLGRMVALGAGLGAVGGYGYSEAETLPELAKDIATGGALGGALPIVGRGIAKGIQSLKPVADEAIKTSLTGFTGKTRAFLDQLDKNPEQVKRIEEKFAGELQSEVLPEISMKIDRFVERNPFAQRAKLNSKLSVEKIPENVRVDKKPAIQEIDKVLDVLKKDTVTDTSREAQKILNDYKFRIINELGSTEAGIPTLDISGRDLKIFLQNIGDDIEKHGGYGNPLKNTKVGQTLKNVRRALDQELKDKAPDYREIMKTVNNDTAASVRLTKQFMNKEGVDSGKINTFINRTTQKPVLMETDRPTKRAVELLQQDIPLQTLGQDIKDINLKKAIEARGNQGSNIATPVTLGFTALGGGLGQVIGGTPGAFIGSGLGGFAGNIASRQLEQRGGKIAESVLRATKGIRTPSSVPQSTQRGFATQQGLQRGLLDQYLQGIAQERNRQKQAESRYEQLNPNRVEK